MCEKPRAVTAAATAAPASASKAATALTAAPHGVASTAEDDDTTSKRSRPPSPSSNSDSIAETRDVPASLPPPHSSTTLPRIDALVGNRSSAFKNDTSNNQVELEQLIDDDDSTSAGDATEDNNKSVDSSVMGQCYPKCMNESVDESGRVLPGMRAKRASKPRHSLSAMKTLSPSDDLDDLEAVDPTAAAAMATLDLEELGSESIVTTLLPEAPTSIVVDYEDALDAALPRVRQNSVTDCARDACRPLGSDYAQQLAAEDPVLDLKSAPVTPGRRRSRKDSVGDSGTAAVVNAGPSSSSAVTPRRGKTLVVQRAPVSPSTDTDVSDDEERCTSAPKLCLCEVKRHKSRASCWLVVGSHVYDVTGILDVHPGGSRSILRKAGGADCTQDMKFHTKNARRMLEQCFIGKLQPCGDVPERQDGNCSIM